MKFGCGIDVWDMLLLVILKKLFLSLFAKSNVSGFRCDIYELAKSHRASFPLILNKSLLPFMVIHSDV